MTKTACTWGPPLGPGSVLLLGDSNAGHFAEPVLQAARDSSLGLTMATFGGCAFADVRIRYDVAFDETGCANFIQRWTEEVKRTRPAVVVLSNSSAEYVNAGNGVTFDDPTGRHPPASTAEEKAVAWEAGIEHTIKSWADVGVPTIVVHAVPHWASFDIRRCPSFRVLLDVESCGRHLPRAMAERQLRIAKQAEAAAVARVPEADALDLIAEICTADTCTTNRGQEWMYRDRRASDGAVLVDADEPIQRRHHVRTRQPRHDGRGLTVIARAMTLINGSSKCRGLRQYKYGPTH